MYKRILVPVDGSPTSILGLQQALGLARDQSARVRIINVVDELVVTQPMDMYAITQSTDLLEALRESGRNALEKAAALAAKHQVKTESGLLESRGRAVSDVILDEATTWRADLLVMGTHGRRGMNRMLLGSDAERVLREAPVPILLVRADEHKQRTVKKPPAK